MESVKIRKKWQPQKNREIILNRQDQVANLHYVEHKTIHEIARELGWNPDTIWNDIKTIRGRYAEQIKNLDAKEVWGQIWETRKRVLDGLWSDYESSIQSQGEKGIYIRSILLGKINTITQENVNDLQKLGFIAKPVERSETVTKDYRFEVVINGQPIIEQDKDK